jgi:hypothetical protein
MWHQLQKVDNIDVIVSGWSITNESCNALDAWNAITRHSIITDEIFVGFYWIMVMQNDNYFIQKVHHRLKFKQADKGSSMEKWVKNLFQMQVLMIFCIIFY